MRTIKQMKRKQYPAVCQKIATVDSHNSIGIERKENTKKHTLFRILTYIDLKKYMHYFDVIS